MSDEYTPTTEHVRALYIVAARMEYGGSNSTHKANFNRWLAAHDRKERRVAWAEGYTAGASDGTTDVWESASPYEEGEPE